MNQRDIVQELFTDASNYKSKMKKVDFSEDPLISGPRIVIDPRRVGYDYLSYVFIESGEKLPDIRDESRKIVDDFQDYRGNNSAFLGIALGDHDIVHRRAEQKQYTHAEFSVESINSDEMNYIQSIETYPIWAIARWHGQKIPEERMFGDEDFDPPTELECEIIYEYMQHPTYDEAKIIGEIERRVRNDNEPAIFSEMGELPADHESKIRKKIKKMNREGVILGESIGVNASKLGIHVIIGIDVEEFDDDELENERRSFDKGMLARDPLPNELIMHRIRKEFDDRWKMPYIVSGVGQNWADILIEMHIDDVQDMYDNAERLRDVPGVKSTHTKLLTHEAANEPLKISDPNYINETK